LAALVIVAAAVNVAAWRLTLRLLAGGDLPAGLYYWDRFRLAVLPHYVFQVIRHVIDYATWGFVWPVVLAVTLTTRRWAAVASIGGTLAVFGLAYAVGPPSMIEWAAQGIQLNRLLLQTL